MTSNPRKRKIGDDGQDVQALTASKRFASKLKDLRSLLQTSNDEVQGVLEDFLVLLRHSKYRQSAASSFLAEGGSCREIFQQLEHDSQSCAVRLEVVTCLMAHIASGSEHTHLQQACEACQHLLSAHLPLVQRLCSSNSVSNVERRAVLQLFCGMVQLRPALAGEILERITFNTLLYTRQHLAHAADVRYAYINFIVALLVDDDRATLAQLLQRPHLLAGVVGGLLYDRHDCVVGVLEALRCRLVDGGARVSKSLKMRAFSTQTLRHLVQLYDWKGPTCYDVRRRRPIAGAVDVQHRAAVADAVHGCLMPLCTSALVGVVFNDALLGAGREHRNPLLYSMLDALAVEQLLGSALLAELAASTCAAAPDLVRPMWAKLVVCVQPRDSPTWRAAMAFVRQLLDAVDADAIARRAYSLSALQYAQVVQMLVAPAPILQAMLADDLNAHAVPVRAEIVRTLSAVADGVQRHLAAASETLRPNYVRILRTLLVDQLERHMPPGEVLTRHWLDDAALAVSVVRLLAAYAQLAPDLLLRLRFDDPPNILARGCTFGDEFSVLFLRFLGAHDARLLAADAPLFPDAVCTLAQAMRVAHVVDDARPTFTRLLLQSGLFDAAGSQRAREVALWVDAAQLKHTPAFLSTCLVMACQCAADLHRELRTFGDDGADDDEASHVAAILRRLQAGRAADSAPIDDVASLRMSFSIVTLQCLRTLPAAHPKIVGHIAAVLVDIFHLQSDIAPFQALVAAYRSHLPHAIAGYMLSYGSTRFPYHATTSSARRIAGAVCWLTQGPPAGDDYETLADVVTDSLDADQDGAHVELVYGHAKLLAAFMQPPGGVLTRFVLDVTSHLQPHRFQHADAFVAAYRRKLRRIVMSPHLQLEADAASVANVERIGGLIRSDDCVQMLRDIASHANVDDLFNAETQRANLRCKLLVVLLHQLAADDATDGSLHRLVDLFNGLNAANADTGELALALKATWTRHFADAATTSKLQLCAAVLRRAEYCKRNAQLMIEVLAGAAGDDVLVRLLQPTDAIDVICSKRGHVLLILDLLYDRASSSQPPLAAVVDAAAACFLQQMLPLISKVLAKPQKAGARVAQHSVGLCALIERCMPLEAIRALGVLDRTRKYDRCDVVVAALLSAIGRRCAALSPSISVGHLATSIMHVMVSMAAVDPVLAAGAHLTRLLDAAHLDLDTLRRDNDVVKRLHVFCLEYGVSTEERDTQLLELLQRFANACAYSASEVGELAALLFGHASFQHVVRATPSVGKQRVFALAHAWLRRQPSAMCATHMRHLLAAYTATRHPCDAAILSLLRLYAASPQRTRFYDFRPLMWGAVAYRFYAPDDDGGGGGGGGPQRLASVADVLRLLDADMVAQTIREGDDGAEPAGVYDVGFLLSVFSQLLASEQRVHVGRVARAGVVALVAHALGRRERDVRLAACHVLARFFHHVQAARVVRSEHLVWTRYVQTLACGAAHIERRPLNGFASVFMARAALVLAEPQHEMFAPLCNFLGVRATPSLAGVPEVHALLQASCVAHAAQRDFILDVIADGMRCGADLDVVVRGKVLKLIMCMHDARVADAETRKRVLRVLRAATALPIGVQQLCDAHALFGWLHLHAARMADAPATTDRPTSALMADIACNLCRHYETHQDGAAATLFARLHADLIALRDQFA